MNEQILEAARALRHAARLLEAAAGAEGVIEQAETPAPAEPAASINVDRAVLALWRHDLLTSAEVADRLGLRENEVRARLVAAGVDPDLDRAERDA